MGGDTEEDVWGGVFVFVGHKRLFDTDGTFNQDALIAAVCLLL